MSRLTTASLCAVVVLCAIQSLAAVPASREAEPPTHELITRLRAPHTDDETNRVRADVLVHLARRAPDDPDAQDAALGFVEQFARQYMLPPTYSRYLAMFGKGFPERLGTTLSRTEDPELYGVFLATLVRMGDRSRGQIPRLLAELDQPFILKEGLPNDLDELARGGLRITLLALGGARPADVRQLEKDLRERTAAGRGAAGQLLYIGLGPWVTDSMVSSLQAWMRAEPNEPNTATPWLAVVLASGNRLNEDDRQWVRSLRDRVRPDNAAYSSAYLLYCYALALADPDDALSQWKYGAARLGTSGVNHTDYAVLINIAVTMPEKHAEIVRALVTDADEQVRAGAALMMDVLGQIVPST